jgi:two-component system OmpR family response regulator
MVRIKKQMRILVVEDEAAIARQLAAALTDAGYAVDTAADGEKAEFLGQTERYDAIVLDLGLPKVDGMSVLRRWREAGMVAPVLILTARDSWHEKVQGIDGGADDYVAKPFQMEEVLARLRALIRRASGRSTPELRAGNVVLDPRLSRVPLDGAPVKLTSHEFRVLSYLMHNPGRIVSQGELTPNTSTHRTRTAIRTRWKCSSAAPPKLGATLIEKPSAGSAIGLRPEHDQKPRSSRGGCADRRSDLSALLMAGTTELITVYMRFHGQPRAAHWLMLLALTLIFFVTGLWMLSRGLLPFECFAAAFRRGP